MTPAEAATASRHRRLKLVVGRPGAGRGGIQEAFVEEVRRLKTGDPLRPIAVLVGGNYLRLHLSRLLAIRMGGHVGIRFETLEEVARDLGAGPLLDRGRRALPEFGREILLREAIAARTHGSYFRDIAGREGFLEALAATLSDLKEAAVEPATLRATAAMRRSGTSREAADPVSAGKLDDLADLFEAYDDLLRDRRFYDEEELLRSAAQRAPASATGERRGSPEPTVLVYGFYDANWVQRQLIQGALAHREGVVFFPYEPGDPEASYDYAAPMLDWLASWIPSRADLPLPPRVSGPEVAFLSAPGEVRETLEATRWLISRAREGALPFGEMGLVYRAAGQYRDLAPELMAQAGGVPRFLSEGRPLASTPAARVMLLILRARDEGMSRRSVLDLLALASPDADAALWDRLSRDAGVVRGIADWRRRMERLGTRPQLSRPARDLLRRVEELDEGLSSLPVSGRWRDMADAALSVLRRFAPPCRSLEQVEARLEMLGSLDEVATPVDLERFASMVRRALDRASARGPEEGEFQKSGLFVGNVMEARLLSFHALAIVGLVEREFPAPARQDPILLDDEREAVNRIVGAGRLPLKSHRSEEERLLFKLACSSASESLLLSYPRLEPATARPRLPSPFLLRTASRMEGRRIDYEALERLGRMRRVSLAAVGPKDPSAAILSREFDLCALRATPDEPAARRRLATFLRANPLLHRALEAEEARWGEPRFTAHDGVILRPGVLDSLRAIHPSSGKSVSSSGIEAYASCPLAYFMKEILDLEVVEEPEESRRLHPRRRGSLVHGILFDLFMDLRDRGLLPIEEETVAAALEALKPIAARHFADQEAAGACGPRMMWDLDKEQILEDLSHAIAEEAARPGRSTGAPFVPAHFEVRFGMEARGAVEREDPLSTSEPVTFEIAPGRAVAIRGRIDRLETSPDATRVRITDYKTGRMSGFKDDSLLGGTSVQLPIYMVAAEKLLAARYPGIRAAEARYLSVDRKGEFRQVGYTHEALDSGRQDLARILTTYLNGVARGVFFAYPEPDMCRYCDYRLACGEGREARFARKRGDGTASDFLRMREGIA